jgi:hypothetical protein
MSTRLGEIAVLIHQRNSRRRIAVASIVGFLAWLFYSLREGWYWGGFTVFGLFNQSWHMIGLAPVALAFLLRLNVLIVGACAIGYFLVPELIALTPVIGRGDGWHGDLRTGLGVGGVFAVLLFACSFVDRSVQP